MFQTIRKMPGFFKGVWDFVKNPKQKEAWEGAFNAQSGRQEIFLELLRVCSFDMILETGTFRGVTTSYMATQSRLPVLSVESEPQLWGYAWARLLFLKNVKLKCMDSRVFLKLAFQKWCNESQNLFFYLDAHWAQSLPLREEVNHIFSKTKHAVIMIDDFFVTDDPGYQFDNYGEGKRLSMDYLGLPHGLAHVFFPTRPSSLETGAKRGCVVLCASEDKKQELQKITSLREWKPQ